MRRDITAHERQSAKDLEKTMEKRWQLIEAREAHQMELVHRNVSEVRAKLGGFVEDIDEIHTLRKRGDETLARVNSSLEMMKDARHTMDERLKDGLQKTADQATVVAREAVVPAVDD